MSVMDAQQGPTKGDPGALLRRRSLGSLAAVAVLVLLNQLLVQSPLLRMTADAPTINLAGRQRMLSQRIAKSALALVATRDEIARRRHREELAQVVRLWATSHEALVRSGRNSPAVAASYETLAPLYVRMREAARDLVRDAPGRRDAALATILADEPEYLERMDRIVGLHEREARARVDRLRRTGWLVAGATLLGLVAIGRFILRPASLTIGRQVEELRAARDALEARVLERTAALERANRDLAREVRERTLAEDRQRASVEQFSHVARTTIIGEMASGLAHELNQPLGAIANYAEGCLVALDAPDPPLAEVRDALGKVLATTLRAGQIVQRIRRFVTRNRVPVEPFEPNRLVAEVEEFFRDEARRLGIGVRLELAPDLPNLQGDPVQIQQVLVNLVRNAIEAISGTEIQEPTIVIGTGPALAGGVEFRVGDNGEGIPEGELDRIFDAYFSTRDDGMGMGLAISRTIVEAHHGRISVESTPGVRTTFRFILPPPTRADADHADDAGTDGLHRGR